MSPEETFWSSVSREPAIPPINAREQASVAPTLWAADHPPPPHLTPIRQYVWSFLLTNSSFLQPSFSIPSPTPQCKPLSPHANLLPPE